MYAQSQNFGKQHKLKVLTVNFNNNISNKKHKTLLIMAMA